MRTNIFLFIFFLLISDYCQTSHLESNRSNNTDIVIKKELKRISHSIDTSLHSCLMHLYNTPENTKQSDLEFDNAYKGLYELKDLFDSLSPFIKYSAKNALNEIIQVVRTYQHNVDSPYFTEVEGFKQLVAENKKDQLTAHKENFNTILKVIAMYDLFCHTLGPNDDILQPLEQLYALAQNHSIGRVNAWLGFHCMNTINNLTNTLPGVCTAYKQVLKNNNVDLTIDTQEALSTIEVSNNSLKNLCLQYTSSPETQKELWPTIENSLISLRKLIVDFYTAQNNTFCDTKSLKSSKLLKKLDEPLFNNFNIKLETVKEGKEKVIAYAKVTPLALLEEYSPRNLINSLYFLPQRLFLKAKDKSWNFMFRLVGKTQEKSDSLLNSMQEHITHKTLPPDVIFTLQHKKFSKLYTTIITPLVANSEYAYTFLKWFDNKYCYGTLAIKEIKKSIHNNIDPTKLLDLVHKMMGNGPFYRFVDIVLDLEKAYPGCTIETIGKKLNHSNEAFVGYLNTVVETQQKNIGIQYHIHSIEEILTTTLPTTLGTTSCIKTIYSLHKKNTLKYLQQEKKNSEVSPLSFLYYAFPDPMKKVILQTFLKKLITNFSHPAVNKFLVDFNQEFVYAQSQNENRHRTHLQKMNTLVPDTMKKEVTKIFQHKKRFYESEKNWVALTTLKNELFKKTNYLFNKKELIDNTIIAKWDANKTPQEMNNYPKNINLAKNSLDQEIQSRTKRLENYNQIATRMLQVIVKQQEEIKSIETSLTLFDSIWNWIGRSSKHHNLRDLKKQYSNYIRIQNTSSPLYDKVQKNLSQLEDFKIKYITLDTQLNNFTRLYNTVNQQLVLLSSK